MVNRARVSKFGFRLGEVTLFFSKAGGRMMRSLLACCCRGRGFAAAASILDDSRLELKAQARACYGLHQALRRRLPRPARVGRCIRLSYLRDFSGEALDEATVKVFKQRHGEAMVARYREDLACIGAASPAGSPR